MSLNQLQAKREQLIETIAFNVSCPEMLPYQRAYLAKIEAAIARLAF